MLGADLSDDQDDQELSDDEILVQKLPVAQFDSFDVNTPPACGEDYLRRVQIEAQKCPDVVVADLDLTKFKQNQTYLVSNNNEFTKARPECLPSVDWQRLQLADFTKLRMRIARMKTLCPDSSSHCPLPKNRSMSWWKDFCLGTSQGTQSSESESESFQSSIQETPKSISSLQQEQTCSGRPPLLNDIIALSQDEIHRVLDYHGKWMKQHGFSSQNGLWIYALLALLEKPLPSEVYAVLRQVSRVCAEVRAKVDATSDSDVKKLTSLNLIICLIGRYFDQTDLIDE